MSSIYIVGNFAMQTTAAPAKMAIAANTIKTLIQIKPLVTVRIREWGISFDGSAAGTPGIVELIETGTVFATVTAYAAADFTKCNGEALVAGDPTLLYFSVGTAASGFGASAEGTITAVRNLDAPQLIAPTTQFIKQEVLAEDSVIQAGNSARIRVTFAAAVNCLAYLKLEA